MDRRETLCALFDATGFGLEIGPSYSPVLPKSAGYTVETLDYASRDELRHKYRDAGVDIERIETVDYVSDGRPMREVIGASGRYDFILASHVVEHTPDLVGFLTECEALLKPDGVLVLALPTSAAASTSSCRSPRPARSSTPMPKNAPARAPAPCSTRSPTP